MLCKGHITSYMGKQRMQIYAVSIRETQLYSISSDWELDDVKSLPFVKYIGFLNVLRVSMINLFVCSFFSHNPQFNFFATSSDFSAIMFVLVATTGSIFYFISSINKTFNAALCCSPIV